ncbi:MAG: hypothetical protein Q4G04_06905 [bacterium]|nr:hypothetical protein [bacterium]
MKTIPKKNYITLTIILVVSFALLFYFYLWYEAYQENKLTTPIINKYISEINYKELDNYLQENMDIVIYTSKLEDERIRNFEKQLKKTILDYNLRDKILYLDITYEDKDSISKQYYINNNNITNVPNILIFENGEIVDIYSIKDNNYDIELLVSYLKNKGVIE